MSHYVYGGVVCDTCGTYHDEAKIKEISEADDHGSLILCKKCEKWRKWNTKED